MAIAPIEQPLRRAGHYIVSEAANMYRSREQAVLKSGSGVLRAGTVLAKETASGKYVPLNPGGTGGAGKAAAILYDDRDATAADTRCTVSVRDMEFHGDVVVWPDLITDAQKATALSDLAALGMIARFEQ